MFQLLHFSFVVGFILNSHFLITSASDDYYYYYCSGSTNRCPNGEYIQYPFYIENSNNEYNCGYPGFSAKCSGGGRPIVSFSNHSYYYQYTHNSMGTDVRLMDIDTTDQNCPQPRHNFSLNQEAIAFSSLLSYGTNVTYFYNCSTLPKHVSPNLQCIDQNSYNASRRSFAMETSRIPVGFNWYANCQQKVTVPVSSYYDQMNYTQVLKVGIDLWFTPKEHCQVCENSGGSCAYKRNSSIFSCICNGRKLYSGGKLFNKRCPPKGNPKKLFTGLLVGVGGSFLILLLTYTWRCSKSSPTNEEVFLQSYGSHGVQRYKYSEVKRMTNSFKDRLGQGGFGLVVKGKLPDGRLVAVKLLNESKADGEEFINEVATIGRTNHVNVVTLIGFCIDGTKRALVYEFMVNGSLDKFIYKEKLSITTYAPALGWDKLYQIALGIARGLEYLHRGCNNRILHFDIKPHNILLDSEFVPKISDFGLAKFSQTRDSVVSVVGTRGTNGYIAPEIYCRNFGRVSYKSDVYSYGMMLFEMIGGRKNIDATVENISEIYFPHWIYNHLNKAKNTEESEDIQINVSQDILQDEIARKMIIIALWCIQAHPNDRPSMKKVAEMLEETNDKLQMPPDPSIHPFSGLLPQSP